MKVTGSIQEVRAEVLRAKGQDHRIGFVPTMGALHEGHMSLVRRSKADRCFTVVSIYVNPAQFGPKEDLGRYPRPIEKDLELCREARVDLVFTPADAQIYGPGSATWVDVDGITGGLCGAFRPGHFRGVATVVAKLFGIVMPDAAYFGRKDFQQLKVIERMAADLFLPVEVVGCPLIRNDDGVALSSRNAYLTPAERERARTIPRLLREVAARWDKGVRTAGGLLDGLAEKLAAAADSIDYFGAYHPDTLVPLPPGEPLAVNPVIALAVRIGRTRLIDNLQAGVDVITRITYGPSRQRRSRGRAF